MEAKENGPHEFTYEEELIWLIHNVSILATTKIEIMQCAVTKSPKCALVPTESKYHPCWIQAVK